MILGHRQRRREELLNFGYRLGFLHGKLAADALLTGCSGRAQKEGQLDLVTYIERIRLEVSEIQVPEPVSS